MNEITKKIEEVREGINVVDQAIDEWSKLMNVALQTTENAFRIAKIVKRNGPYLIIHKQSYLEYNGKKAKLVWDFGLWNELTIEIYETDGNSTKYSVAEKLPDEEIERIFDDIVAKYGNN